MRYKLFKIDKRYNNKRAYLVFDINAIGSCDIRFVDNRDDASTFDDDADVMSKEFTLMPFLKEYISTFKKNKLVKYYIVPHAVSVNSPQKIFNEFNILPYKR